MNLLVKVMDVQGPFILRNGFPSLNVENYIEGGFILQAENLLDSKIHVTNSDIKAKARRNIVITTQKAVIQGILLTVYV